MAERRRASLRLDVRGLDDGPPFLDFGFLEGSERIGHLRVLP
jgi:hypothetical protein